jgi:PAS domain S-box-containing protein
VQTKRQSTQVTGAASGRGASGLPADIFPADSEQFLKRILAGAPVAICVMKGPDLRFTLVNDAYQAILGGDTQFVGRTYGDLFPQAADRGAEEWLRNVMRTGEEWHVRDFETEVPGREGMTWWDGECLPLSNEKGEFDSVLVLTWEITDRKLAERAIRESEERFRLAQSIAHVGTFELNIQSGLNIWTPELEAMYGLKPGEFSRTQRAWADLVHPDDRVGALARVDEALQTGRPTEHEWRVVWPDGSVHWMAGRFQCLPDAQGNPLLLSGVNIDITERKRAEEALRQSEERFRDMANAVPAIVWTAAPNGDITYASDRWFEFTGITPEENRRGWPDSVLHPDDHERCVEAWARAVRDGTEYEIEVRNRRRDGKYRWFLTRATPVRGPGGEIQEWYGSTTDIHDRKEAEEALRESEERFARFMQQHPGLAWIKDAQGRYIYANDAAEKAFQRSREKLYGKTDSEIFPAEVAAQFAENDRRALGSESGVQVVETLEHDDGVLHHSIVSKFPIPGPDGLPILIGGMAIDITELRQADEALRESEERFRNMANSSPVMIWVTEPDASCSFLSTSWFEFTGQAVEEALGFGWLEAVHPHDRKEVTQTALDRNELGGPFRVEYRLCRHDGEYRWMLASAAPRVGRAGEFLGYIGSIIDITDRREIEQELRRANAAKDEFLGLVSHELRTPITTILGMSHILRSRADSLSREERQMGLNDIANDAQRLDRIVRNLLILARLEEGQVPEMEPLLLGKILSRLVHEQKRRSRRKITIDIAGDLPVTGHADYIEQIVRNLLSNAEKYGSLSEPVEVALHPYGDFARVSVSDRGKGVPEAEREAIFAPFFRSESTQGLQGIGIGLAVCRRLAEAMGGRIWVEPRDGGGSTFAFTLPVYRELT